MAGLSHPTQPFPSGADITGDWTSLKDKECTLLAGRKSMGWTSASVAPRSGVSTQKKKKIGARSITDQVDNGLKLLGPLPLTDGKVYVSSPFRNVQKLVQSGSRGAGAFGGGSGCGRWRGPVTDLTGPLSGSPGMRRGRESWWKLFSTGYGQESTRGINGPGLIRGWEAAQFCGIAGPTRGRCCRVQGRGAVSLLFRHGRQCFCFCFVFVLSFAT